ncbi:hypothetical protein BB427_20340 [Pseudoalteromonas sp. BMB]|uniref:hypothetical protein n=1 Tax=Pseudoalteromonas sp. BMB TaxID=1874619 RepID=UPI00083CC6EF|nr:hypothetical protein [Pseudoalteromonas sp. BMB]ODB33957.1 hypothetical protein BB427_20340 [Pseudoalteromonas sp. BMB]
MYITDTKKVDDWLLIRKEAIKSSDSLLWMTIFKDFFYGRLESRYLTPIKSLQKGSCLGEGFSISAIHCSIIEFLESTYEGINYKWVRKDSELGKYEYKSSKKCFINFLTQRYPFSIVFNEEIASDFYSSVRCGLLHEASTKNGWKVLASSHSGTEIVCAETKKVFRNDFQKAIDSYIAWYQTQLIKSDKLQKAFIRKFDSICE